jgi:hypothetical protein
VWRALCASHATRLNPRYCRFTRQGGFVRTGSLANRGNLEDCWSKAPVGVSLTLVVARYNHTKVSLFLSMPTLSVVTPTAPRPAPRYWTSYHECAYANSFLSHPIDAESSALTLQADVIARCSFFSCSRVFVRIRGTLLPYLS